MFCNDDPAALRELSAQEGNGYLQGEKEITSSAADLGRTPGAYGGDTSQQHCRETAVPTSSSFAQELRTCSVGDRERREGRELTGCVE